MIFGADRPDPHRPPFFEGYIMKQLAVLVLFVVFASVVGTGAEVQDGNEPEDVEESGFVVAGRTVRLAATETGNSSPAGRLENYSSARMVEDLLTVGDTLWIGTEGGLFAYCISRDSIIYVPTPLSGSIEAIAADDAGSLWIGGRNGLGIRSGRGWTRFTGDANRFFTRITDISPGEGGVWLASYGEGAGFVNGGDITIYTRDDSLLDDRVLRVLEQERSTVWFGTASGMCRADTLQWQSMRYGSRLPIGSVNDILLDEEGNLFIAVARRGVAVYNLGRVRTYGPGRGLPELDVAGFSLDPLGKVWAAGRSGVSTFDGSSWIPQRLTGIPIGRYNFLSIHHGMDGECYLGTDEGNILIIGRETVRQIVLPQRFPENTVTRLRMFGGALWAIGVDRLYRLGDEAGVIELPDLHYRGTLTDVWEGEGGEVWVSSRLGLLRYDGSSWEVFDRRQGLPTEQFNGIVRGGEGDLWFGTHERGVLRFSGGTWVHYSAGSGLPDDRIEDIIVDRNGEPWVLTATGEIARYHEGRWEGLTLPIEVQEKEMGPDSILVREPFIRFISSTDDRPIQAGGSGRCVLGLDGPGNCMVACERGIYRFSGSSWQIIDPPEGVSSLRATALLGTARGTIWVGTEESGIFIRSRGGWRRLGTDQGLSDDHIESLCEDASGNIWIGTRFGGLSRFSPGPTLD
jgi:ligand-binding sensor domain-containing protein